MESAEARGRTRSATDGTAAARLRAILPRQTTRGTGSMAASRTHATDTGSCTATRPGYATPVLKSG